MKKELYCIVDGKGSIYPKTHIFVLKDDMEAVYTFINFGAILQDDNISLLHIGTSDSKKYVDASSARGLLCEFTGIVDFVNDNYPDDYSHPDLSKEILINSYNFAFERIFLNIEKQSLILQLSEARKNKEAFDKNEIDKILERLQYIDNKLGLVKHENINN